jgi:hypothetical protein
VGELYAQGELSVFVEVYFRRLNVKTLISDILQRIWIFSGNRSKLCLKFQQYLKNADISVPLLDSHTLYIQKIDKTYSIKPYRLFFHRMSNQS